MSGKSEKHGRNKSSASNVTYKATDRYSKNKRRRAAKQERTLEAQTAKYLHVSRLRAKGAIARLKRRIDEITSKIRDDKPNEAQAAALKKLQVSQEKAVRRLHDFGGQVA